AAHPAHIYSDTGYFTVTLTISNNGCKNSLVTSYFIHIRPPIARFSDLSGCDSPFSHQFKDLSTGADSWFWNFGDGTASNEQSPTHIFTKAGNYIVSLTVKSDSCENTSSKQVQIVFEKADFSTSDTIICKGTNV